MALVGPPGLPRQTTSTTATRKALATKRQKRHRVVLENVTQEQKKLRTVISFKAQPPPGYTFIPAGNPELTNAMKEFARQGNHQIYAVTTTPHAKVHDLSKEVHRIGFHFPSIVVAQVCAQYGVVLSSAGTLVTDEDAQTFSQRRRRGKNTKPDKDDDADQITVNTRARGAIKDLFPKIPDNDLHTIIKTAFQKGRGKVGTANELPLVRRAQLSVVAHIRHIYTNYDRLLRQVGYHEARTQVEKPTLAKLVEWRGDDDNGRQVLEDVFREVIVLSDDDDSDDDDMHDTQELHRRELSVEFIPASAVGASRSKYDPATQNRPLSPRRGDYDYTSEDEAPSGYRFVTQAPRRRRIIDIATNGVGNSDEHRYAAWDRAREQYRAAPLNVAAPRITLTHYEPELYHHQSDLTLKDSGSKPSYDAAHSQRATGSLSFAGLQGSSVRRTSPPAVIRGADGALYERVYSTRSGNLSAQSRSKVNSSLPAHTSSQSYIPHDAMPLQNQHPRTRDTDSIVLPSIENVQSSPTAPRPAVRDHRRAGEAIDGFDYRLQAHERPHEVEIIDLTDVNDPQYFKRRKFNDSDTVRRSIASFDGPSYSTERAGFRSGGRDRYSDAERIQRDPEIMLPSNGGSHSEAFARPRRLEHERLPDAIAQFRRSQQTTVTPGKAHRVIEVSSAPSQSRRVIQSDSPYDQNARPAKYTSPPRFSMDLPVAKNERVSRVAYLHDSHVNQSGTIGQHLRDYRPPYGGQTYSTQLHDVEYGPEDPAIRSEELVARRITAPAHRDGGGPEHVPSVRVLMYSDEYSSNSREYIPVNRSTASRPVQFMDPQSAGHPSISQESRGTYPAPLERNGADSRYERMPPPTYIRN